jgi:GH35 family endo-1,4-beta-xylanase
MWKPVLRSTLPWLLRLSLAVFLLRGFAEPITAVPLDPPQRVITQKAQVCVHTRLIDEVYEGVIQRSLQMVREMGADTIVEFFPWAYAEPVKGQYDWSNFDRIVRHARNQGLHIIARMGLVPAWARPDSAVTNSTLNTLPEDSYADFAAFVSTFAGRYAGVIDHIIIWNEPNLAFEWGFQAVDPAGYVRLLQVVYQPIHAANPAAMVLAAPLAPTLEPPGSPNGLNDLLYLEALYQAGMRGHYDAMAMHTYGFTEPPEAPPDPAALNYRRAELLYAIMSRYGDAEVPVYITETGWNDHPRWTKAVRPSLRVEYTINAFRWAEAHWPWARKVCIWAFRYPAPTNNYPDNFTLVNGDFQPRPIYSAIQAYALGRETGEALWLPAPTG